MRAPMPSIVPPATAGGMACFAACACLLATAAACAPADVGKLGPTYPVTEPGFLAMVEERLRAKAESGELARLREQAAARAREAITSPAPVAGLAACTRARSYHFDPSVVLTENIFDASGNLLFAAGTRKNPLDVVSLSRPLLFFDARDARQRGKAFLLLQRHARRIKLVLTGGSYLELARQWHTPVFFDQHGLLTRRLGIRNVPALVTQDGPRLRIDEMAVTP